MPITKKQKEQAEEHQWAVAKDGAPQVRLVAGPGTGKSHTIEKRVADLLTNGATPGNVYVISFTRAMSCCIASHAAQHTNAQAMALTQKFVARLTRFQFLNEMSVPSVTRISGLSQVEAAAIVAELRNL